MRNYEGTEAKFPKGDTVEDMLARAVGEYFNEFVADDAMELLYWLYVAHKLETLVKAGLRIRADDLGLQRLRAVTARLRK